LIEAAIDFSDEGDVPEELIAPALARVQSLLEEIKEVLDAQGRSERLREGLVVAISGPPNVGKSTLMNYLARREVAIVSPHAGTTRDVIEVQLDLDGYPVTLIDTAGIRQTDDPVELEGVRRARMRAAEADLVLWMTDPEHQQSTIAGDSRAADASVWLIRNKIDLDEGSRIIPNESAIEPAAEGSSTEFRISASRGEGIPELITALVSFARDYFGSGEGALIGRERQRNLLQQSLSALARCISAAGEGEELAAEELRAASYFLGRLLGRIDVEDVLDAIFREFCIGK
jgi:tRNA modification GTPase